MKKRGFTLVELLAVIVVLAIVALISIPMVSKLIGNTKIKAAEKSAMNYIDSVESAIIAKKVGKGIVKDGTYGVDVDGNLCLLNTDCSDENKIIVKIGGKTPLVGTNIVIKDNDVILDGETNNTIIKIDKYILLYENEKTTTGESICYTISGDGSNVGDEIVCADEHFYVISNDGITINMLAKYNLNVGSQTYSGGRIGIQNENVVGSKSGYTTYGNMAFSSSYYWTDENEDLLPKYGTRYNAWVYDSNSNLYPYVENYTKYLTDKGLFNAKGTLISDGQVYDLRNKKGNPDWVYNTGYWTGTAASNRLMRHVYSSKTASSGSMGATSSSYGVRPVIVMPAANITIGS